jgi:ribonuclease HII
VQDEVESGSPNSTPISDPTPSPNDQLKPHRRRVPRRKRWTTIERDLRLEKGPLLAGVDEVGRGPIAGPVVACAVIMPPDTRAIAGVDDSKLLTHDQRVRLAGKIRERAVAFAIGAASVREIDTINIYQASVLAMQRALTRLRVKPDHVVIDGRAMRTLPIAHTAVVKGDRRCFSIACASILAKVTRDLLMTRLAQRYPQYIWDHNAGYTTREHVVGLTSYGITPHHRKSFCRISDLLLELQHQSELDDREQQQVLADVGIPDEDDLEDDYFEDADG